MNVLMVSPYFYSKACRIKLRPDVYEVSKRLVRRGHRVVVLASKTYGAPSHEVVDGVEVYRVWSLALPKIYYFIPLIPRFMSVLLKICRKYNIDVIHFWNYEYLTSILALILRRKLKNMPFVMTVIGFPGLNWKYGVKIIDLVGSIYTYTVGKITLKAIDNVVLLGKNLAKYALWMGVPTKRICVNSFGLDFQEFLPRKAVNEIRKELGISRAEKVVIFVGRLEPVKGVKHLLNTARSVSRKMNGIKFLVVGDGHLRSELQADSDPQIIFTGWRDDVPNLLNASDLLVLPSLSEGLPLSVLEAYAVGKPVVATNVGAISEVVINGHTGLLVPPQDWKRLTETILYLIAKTKLRHEMGIHGKEFIEKNYNWDKILDIYEEMYRSIQVGKE